MSAAEHKTITIMYMLTKTKGVNNMSSAFVRESDEEWLHEVAPNLNALLLFLRRENGGIYVHQTKTYYCQKQGRDVYEMSNGLAYAKNDDGKWYVVFD